MKACPYCAEEIQENAVICRYCHKKVKGVWSRRIVVILVLSALVFFAILYWPKVKEFAYKIQFFFSDLKNTWKTIKEIVVDIKKGLNAFIQYYDQL